MKDNNNIDYNAKVLNFMAMTETGDPEIAKKYLESCDWDETKAVNQFYNKINNNLSRDNNLINNIININNSNNNNKIINKDINLNNPNNNNIINKEININIKNNTLKEKLIEKNVNNKEIIEVNSDESSDCWSKYILKPFMCLCCSCCKKKDIDNEEEKKSIFELFELLPNNVKNLSEFNQSLINNLGLIIIYNQENSLKF